MIKFQSLRERKLSSTINMHIVEKTTKMKGICRFVDYKSAN